MPNQDGQHLWSPTSNCEIEKWLNGEIQACDQARCNPLIVAALAYQKFISIHPYIDGNGRTGRFLADLILRRYQLLPVAWRENDIELAINITDKNPKIPTEAVSKLIEGVNRSYELMGKTDTPSMLARIKAEAE